MTTEQPLAGIRVLELGQLIAGPFAGTLLAYFGADVIKVEVPGDGDPLRGWRVVQEGTSLWWRSLSRNKRCITLDLRQPAGQDIARRLAATCDVVIENFRPGVAESFGLGPEDIKALNPRVIYTRVSGYGQTGPYAAKPGFAAVCEGMGGLRYITGYPDQPPVRPNLSLGDSLAGLHAAFGILLGLYHRDRQRQPPSDANPPAAGQVIDVAIYESVFNMMESLFPEFDTQGVVRERSGSAISGIVPSNTYRCGDGVYVLIGGNGDSIWRRLMTAAGRPDLAADPRLSTNTGRVENRAEVDAALSAFAASLPAAEVIAKLEAAAVPVGLIYSAADIAADPHYQARQMFESVEVNGRPLRLPAIVPKLSDTPGSTRWPGPDLGSHTREVLTELLGFGDEDLDRAKRDGVI
ncbi:MAG TPA: CaiB/BaiF CoA-transferase family protein [Pseudomonadota bacterium]|nr:CaiB/BaiF CoA-transferase family protein [Pseudomonadota bacterium]